MNKTKPTKQTNEIPDAMRRQLAYIYAEKMEYFGTWTLDIEEQDSVLEGIEYVAYISPHNIVKEHEYSVNTILHTCRETGVSQTDAVEKLRRKVERAYYREAFSKARRVLPYELTKVLDTLGEEWLKVDNTVILGIGGAEDVAMGVLQRAYYDDVRSEAEEILEAVRSGEMDEEEARDRVREGEVIHTSEAHKVILISNNDEAYWEQMGEDAPNWESVASFAKQEDVMEVVIREMDAILKAREEEEGEEEEEEEEEEGTDEPTEP